MKIRMGFVSNSSTSSYCIVGKILGNINVARQILPTFDTDHDFEHYERIVQDLTGNQDAVFRFDMETGWGWIGIDVGGKRLDDVIDAFGDMAKILQVGDIKMIAAGTDSGGYMFNGVN